MLRLHSARMPTVAVGLDELARETEGLSPADLKALCQEAALAAMARAGGDGREPQAASSVTHEDFEEALRCLRAGGVAERARF
jgi:SpoVK/Ycf46/Vps4 family AAA+-type ATPase